MARLVPRGTPDPDGDRRFAERPFPLLEPVGWSGERHRGGYGVADPGSSTIALGLIFGPWETGGPEPRLSVSVGDRFVHDLRKPDPRRLWLLSARLGKQVPIADARSGAFQPAPVTTTSITIEGEPVEFRVFTVDDRWIAQGTWQGFTVEIEGSALEPTDVALRRAPDATPK
ncbi:MAG TPA: hypothetical protein VFX51_24760 [Solirubrobacteraceae bacterium]|nr:hypothetical protein [Solirubrobacteraceae bacterium]